MVISLHFKTVQKYFHQTEETCRSRNEYDWRIIGPFLRRLGHKI